MIDNPSVQSPCRIAEYLPLIRATDGLTLSQVCTLSGLEPSTIQNWIKRGYVPHPVGKKYRERHLARILAYEGINGDGGHFAHAVDFLWMAHRVSTASKITLLNLMDDHLLDMLNDGEKRGEKE